MKNLRELMSGQSAIVDITVFLCETLNQFTTGIKEEEDIKLIYPKALEIYNLIAEQRWHRMKFLNPRDSVIRFSILVSRIYNKRYKTLGTDITDTVMKLNYDLFIFFLLLDEFPVIRNALAKAVSEYDDEYTVFMQAIHWAVTQNCKYQSTFTEAQFIKCADMLYGEYTNPITDYEERYYDL